MIFGILIDGSFIIFLIFLLFALIGGTAYALVDFINDNLGVVIFICAIVIILEILYAWWFSKQIVTSLSTIVYSTQFCFFVVLGIYRLGMMAENHPLKCVLLFFCYAIYGFLNSLGLFLLPTLIDSKNVPKRTIMINSSGMPCCISSIIIGIIGWLINWWILF